MTRIDKFHALPIGKQLQVLSNKKWNMPCERCAFYGSDGCIVHQDLELNLDDCEIGYRIWWTMDYQDGDF